MCFFFATASCVFFKFVSAFNYSELMMIYVSIYIYIITVYAYIYTLFRVF